MTIAYGAIGTFGSGTTSATPAYPTGIAAATSHLYMCVASGGSGDPIPTADAGWKLLVSASGGGGSYGAGTGPRRCTIFKKIVVTGSESGTTTVSLSGGGEMRVLIVRMEAASGKLISEQWTSGEDTTLGTAWSATGAAALAWATSYLLFNHLAQSAQGSAPSSRSMSASGITFGSRTAILSANLTVGNQVRHVIDTWPINAGSGSAAPTFTQTDSINEQGVEVWMVLREIDPAVQDMLGGMIPFPR